MILLPLLTFKTEKTINVKPLTPIHSGNKEEEIHKEERVHKEEEIN